MVATPRDTVVSARVVVGADGDIGPHRVRIRAGSIEAIESIDRSAADDVILAPGFVDLQVNGMDDIDCAEADGADWRRLGTMLTATGVTAWLPTLITAPPGAYPSRFERIQTFMSADRAPGEPTPLGIHLEGPFLGDRTGAHPRGAVQPVDLDWIGRLPREVRMMTLGPEVDGALGGIGALRHRGVTVALGHSSASAVETEAALEAGASVATHLFNAMGPLHHRDPGLAVVAMTDRRVIAGLIADLVHVERRMIRLAFAAMGAARIALVTDAVAWRSPRLSGAVTLVDGAPRLVDGTIAGSALRMDRAIRNVVEAAGVDPVDAIRAASATPARAIDASAHGALRIGGRADLVRLDSDTLNVRSTMVGGHVVYDA